MARPSPPRPVPCPSPPTMTSPQARVAPASTLSLLAGVRRSSLGCRPWRSCCRVGFARGGGGPWASWGHLCGSLQLGTEERPSRRAPTPSPPHSSSAVGLGPGPGRNRLCPPPLPHAVVSGRLATSVPCTSFLSLLWLHPGSHLQPQSHSEWPLCPPGALCHPPCAALPARPHARVPSHPRALTPTCPHTRVPSPEHLPHSRLRSTASAPECPGLRHDLWPMWLCVQAHCACELPGGSVPLTPSMCPACEQSWALPCRAHGLVGSVQGHTAATHCCQGNVRDSPGPWRAPRSPAIRGGFSEGATPGSLVSLPTFQPTSFQALLGPLVVPRDGMSEPSQEVGVGRPGDLGHAPSVRHNLQEQLRPGTDRLEVSAWPAQRVGLRPRPAPGGTGVQGWLRGQQPKTVALPTKPPFPHRFRGAMRASGDVAVGPGLWWGRGRSRNVGGAPEA